MPQGSEQLAYMKSYAKSDGVIRFDGMPFVELPISELLEMGSQEPTKTGIVIANHRQTVRLSDASTFNGEPVEFVVSLRVERSATSQAEADLIARTAEKKETNAAMKAAKEAAARQEHVASIQATATNTAVGIAKALQSP